MTLEELRAKKKAAEEEILAVLDKFAKDTGVAVRRVSVGYNLGTTTLEASVELCHGL